MPKSDLAVAVPPPAINALPPAGSRGVVACSLAAYVALFGVPLYELARFAFASDLYSYIVLIPAISGYLVWLEMKQPRAPHAPKRRLALVLLTVGGAGLLAATVMRLGGTPLAVEDRLAITTAAAIAALAGLAACFTGWPRFRALIFPFGLLAFMVPLPGAALHRLELFMQHGSAAVARGLFETAGTPVFYQDLAFHLPGIHLLVAPECSGLRSTMVLFILSVVAGRLFLRSTSARAILACAILPLALARNGFRIFVIGELCVHSGPAMIDSALHRHGGPVFFALSLIPLFLLLVFLQRRERRARTPQLVPSPA